MFGEFEAVTMARSLNKVMREVNDNLSSPERRATFVSCLADAFKLSKQDQYTLEHDKLPTTLTRVLTDYTIIKDNNVLDLLAAIGGENSLNNLRLTLLEYQLSVPEKDLKQDELKKRILELGYSELMVFLIPCDTY